MANQDREMRGKEEQVAFFIPKSASSYACFGRVGHHYSFSKKEPARVTLACDIEMFRMKNDIEETDASGTPLGGAKSTGVTPLSYSGTEPPTPLPTSFPGSTEVLTGDKKKKKKKAVEEEVEEEEELTEPDDDGEEEERPKKKKKKGEKSGKKKKKKVVEEEPEEDNEGWTEDDEEDEDY